MSTSTPPRREHVEIDRDRVLDDELEVEAGPDGLPDRLDLPIDVPEADAVEQELAVPIDDDRR
jgi:hypothetical protein